jgi:L-aspartate oxidase
MTKVSKLENTFGCDVLIIGGGIAGLITALTIKPELSVLIVTKESLNEGSTRYAQGGIAFAVGDDDSVDMHVRDTMIAGVDFCDQDAVRSMVDEGRQGLELLRDFGVKFDGRGDEISMHREGGHSVSRVAHHGDSTGSEISRALCKEVKKRPNIRILENCFLVDLVAENDICSGALCIHGDDEIPIRAQNTVLASGGLGQLFSVTTNPMVITGDGIAAAYRAGARLVDLEFVQFHPTALYEDKIPRFLISEAIRGEGAHILNRAGERIMLGKHPLAELAPRDVVVRAMALHIIESEEDHLFLDVRHLDQRALHEGFPTITRELNSRGYDTGKDLIPISFAAHYTIGGIASDSIGRSSLSALYVCGETACTGVHGANRLASNSLLEGLVYARRIAQNINHHLSPGKYSLADIASSRNRHRPDVELAKLRHRLCENTLRYGGVFRSDKRLTILEDHLSSFSSKLKNFSPSPQRQEIENMIELANLLCTAAKTREESRGTHQRQEFPDPDEHWREHHISFEKGEMTIGKSIAANIEW